MVTFRNVMLERTKHHTRCGNTYMIVYRVKKTSLMVSRPSHNTNTFTEISVLENTEACAQLRLAGYTE